MSSSGNNSKIIELSIDETNELRAKLGLAPLRTANATPTVPTSGDNGGDQEKVLEMSIDESNALRAKLGLAPLRSRRQAEQHAPAINEGEAKAAAARIERARLQRQVQQGAIQNYGNASLATGGAVDGGTNNDTSAVSFTAQMRKAALLQKKKEKQATSSHAKRRGAFVIPKNATDDFNNKEYTEDDVKGLTVGHAVSDFQEGSTTVLTLADSEILASADDGGVLRKQRALNDDEEVRLENVNLAEQDTVQRGLSEKRKMEMGMGRAGGYAGFDDDEFEELGGTQGPSRSARGGLSASGLGGDNDHDKKSKRSKRRGFQIGAMLDQQDEEAESDLFAGQSGKAVSLIPTQADRTMSDFMTAEEEAALRPKKEKKKKDKEFKKKKKKKDKKASKRRMESDDEEDETQAKPAVLISKTKTLADELEESAPVAPIVGRKRNRDAEDDESESATAAKTVDAAEKRAKFEAVMEKGNERTKAAFGKPKRTMADANDEEPDDAFLNAALAKARRLNRLKQLAEKSAPRGADAVAHALEEQTSQIKPEGNSSSVSTGTNGSGGIKFSIDDTREFTLALRAKKEQEERERAKKEAAQAKEVTVKQEKNISNATKAEPETVDDSQDDVDMNELAKEIKDDGLSGADLLNDRTATVGRGLGGVLQMLRQTGDLARKNAGREEQRGRAKDERTAEDYEPLDLSKVVRIDDRRATSKDRELASREIKLEYRDEHGRLLTRKEAFRELSYQFHGYGSGKRKTEKKIKQIAREQAEQRVASKQGTADGGMLGALKATQKATGKAFIVHKT